MTMNKFTSGINTSFSTELNTNINNILKQSMINAINLTNDSQYIEIDSAFVESPPSVDASSSGVYNTTNDFTNSGLYFANNFQDFDDTDKWTPSTSEPSNGTQLVTTSSTSVTCSVKGDGSNPSGTGAYARLSGDTTSGLDLKDLSKDSAIIIYFSTYSNGGGTHKGIIRLSDGSNKVEMYNDGGSVVAGTLTLLIDYSTELVDVYLNGSVSSSNVDISSLTGTEWQIEIAEEGSTVVGTSNGGTITVTNITYNKGEGNTHTYISDNNTSDSTKSFFYYSKVGSIGTYTHKLSNNSGSNYTTVTNKELNILGSAGTGIIVKVEAVEPTSFDCSTASVEDIFPSYYYWGIYY